MKVIVVVGVRQRAPPMFGRAAIMLGIGPHSSFIVIYEHIFSLHMLLIPGIACLIQLLMLALLIHLKHV